VWGWWWTTQVKRKKGFLSNSGEMPHAANKMSRFITALGGGDDSCARAKSEESDRFFPIAL
jgi:hypothetical protein